MVWQIKAVWIEAQKRLEHKGPESSKERGGDDKRVPRIYAEEEDKVGAASLSRATTLNPREILLPAKLIV